MTDNFIIHIARRRAGESPAHFKIIGCTQHRRAYFLNLKKMRTPENKKSKKETSPEVKTRKLKIQYQVRYSEYSYAPQYVPEIKLCGKWLAALGFEYGSEVKITVHEKRLVIEPAHAG